MGKRRVKIWIPGVPIPQGRLRHARWGKPYYPKTSNRHRKYLVEQIESHEVSPFDGPVMVEITVHRPRANSDLDNHAKMVLDALQDAGVIPGDDVRVIRELRLRAESVGDDKADAGTEIVLKALSGLIGSKKD